VKKSRQRNEELQLAAGRGGERNEEETHESGERRNQRGGNRPGQSRRIDSTRRA